MLNHLNKVLALVEALEAFLELQLTETRKRLGQLKILQRIKLQ
jgi:hypothetical protein